MARTRKTGAAAAAPNKKAVEDAAASAAVSALTLEAPSAAITADAEANPDVRVGVADAEATNRDDALSGDPGSAAAVKAEAEPEADAGAEAEAEPEPEPEAEAEAEAEGSDVELAFPLRVRVTNFTRMPVQVPWATLEVGPAPAYATTVVRSEQQLQSLCAELEVLAKLNGLGHEAFAVEPEKEEVE